MKPDHGSRRDLPQAASNASTSSQGIALSDSSTTSSRSGKRTPDPGGEHAAGHVQRLVQVVDPGRRIAIGPQQGHQRFAVHPMPMGEDQELDQCPGLTQAPGVGRYQAAAHGGLEPTQETDAHARVVSHCLDLPAAAASFARRYPQPPPRRQCGIAAGRRPSAPGAAA